MFTARYGLSPYITQIRFVFKQLNIQYIVYLKSWKFSGNKVDCIQCAGVMVTCKFMNVSLQVVSDKRK